MELQLKHDFSKRGLETLGNMYDTIASLNRLDIKSLDPGKTCLVMIDIINGFVREGSLASTRVENIIPPVVHLSKKCDELKILKIAFCDCHSNNSPEFHFFPPHCLQNSSESEVVNELKAVGNYLLINKNSTNGFAEQAFMRFLDKHDERDTFIIVGDCTDICVLQFSLSLKTYFNAKDRESSIIIPVNMVETYDVGSHNADVYNIVSLNIMRNAGIELVSGIV